MSLQGLRPFGVSLLYMGWDVHHGFQLYQSDPSGNYGGWMATCIGSNAQVLYLALRGLCFTQHHCLPSFVLRSVPIAATVNRTLMAFCRRRSPS
jgi:hypothetical protein